MDWNDVVSILCFIPGAFLALTGAVGLLRMPDFYTRLHPAGQVDTFALTFILIGLMFQAKEFAADFWPTVFKLFFILLFMLFTSPTATHAITKGAYLDGLRPYENSDSDSKGQTERTN